MKTYKDALNFLTSEQRKEIADAIAKAETMTSGEIRVLVVAASSVMPKFSKKDQREALRRRAVREFSKLGIQGPQAGRSCFIALTALSKAGKES